MGLEQLKKIMGDSPDHFTHRHQAVLALQAFFQAAHLGDIVNEDQLAGRLIEGLRRFPVQASQISRLFHGTTVGINALVQERGAKVGLITSRGFRDVLEIGRADRPNIYDFVMKRRPPLVPRHLRLEVAERMAATGEVLTALDLHELDAVRRQPVHRLGHAAPLPRGSAPG